MNHFTDLVWVTGMKSPAKSNILTGKLYLSFDKWSRIPVSQQAFILYHEEGHVVNGSLDEFRADEYALKQLVANKYPLSASVKASVAHLDESNPVHLARANRIYQLAKRFDTGYKPLTKRQMKTHVARALQTSMNKRPLFTYESNGSQYEGNFLGLGKKAAERRKAKRAAKQQFKLDKIAARGNARANVAAQGGNYKQNQFSELGKSLYSSIGGGLGAILGGGGAAPTDENYQGDPNGNPQPNGGGNNALLIGVIVVVVLVGVMLYFKKKK